MVALNNIVIAGGGIIGNSIAYYLAKRDVAVTLIDPVGIAPGASSKAGGFLARDWRDGTPLEEMQQLGFELHEQLAKELSSPIDYRRLTCAAVAIDESQRLQKKPVSRKLKDVEWVDKDVIGSVSMGDETSIAQVHPRKLCEAMWEYSKSKGSTLHVGRVIQAVVEEETREMKGVTLEDGTQIDASQFIVACGPWTEQARSWFPKDATNALPQITGIKCHSILVQPPEKVFQQAVFFESDGALGDGDLEVYPRPDGDCYVNGYPDPEGLVTELPGQEVVDPAAVELLQKAMEQTSTILGQVETHTKQVCYWPETPDGLPLIGPLPSISGAFVACGHSVWGILQGPATGLAMSELLLDGRSSNLDLSPFAIDRFEDYGDDF